MACISRTVIVFCTVLAVAGWTVGATRAADTAALSPTVTTAAQPTSRWIVRAVERRSVLVRDNGGSLRLVTTIPDGDWAVKKTVAVNGSRPWGDPPDILENSGGFWRVIRSTGSIAIDGSIKEEVHPEGLVIAPDAVIPDGNWHHFMQGCRAHDVYINDLNTCFDAEPGDTRGRVILQGHRYIVYESCLGDTCDGQPVPVSFGQEVRSVIRMAYDSVRSCGGEFILTEEQWFCEGYGWCGFANTRPDQNVPASVGPVRLVEEAFCVDSSDALCHRNRDYCPPTPRNAPVRTPAGQISIYRFYDPVFINHMVSMDANELGPENGYQFQGLAYRTFMRPFPGARQIFRCRAVTGKLESFVSTDEACEGAGHVLDGPLGYVSAVRSGVAPLGLFRCYSATRNDHLTTTDSSKCDGGNGYVVEFGGPIGYVAE